jgi:hypothetical protein
MSNLIDDLLRWQQEPLSEPILAAIKRIEEKADEYLHAYYTESQNSTHDAAYLHYLKSNIIHRFLVDIRGQKSIIHAIDNAMDYFIEHNRQSKFPDKIGDDLIAWCAEQMDQTGYPKKL